MVPNDLTLGPFKVVALHQLFFGLVDGIINLLVIHINCDIERRHRSPQCLCTTSSGSATYSNSESLRAGLTWRSEKSTRTRASKDSVVKAARKYPDLSISAKI